MGATKLVLILPLLQLISAVVVAAGEASTEAVEEFCASEASATPDDHVAACIKHHLTLADVNKAGRNPHDFILDGLKKARSELLSAVDFTEKEIAPRTNHEKRPLVFNLAVEGCRGAFRMSLGHLDRAVDFFTKPDALNNRGPIPNLLQGLADVMVLTGGCIDAMAETNDSKLEKVIDEKLVMVEEMTSSMDAIITTLTQSQERLLLAR